MKKVCLICIILFMLFSMPACNRDTNNSSKSNISENSEVYISKNSSSIKSNTTEVSVNNTTEITKSTQSTRAIITSSSSISKKSSTTDTGALTTVPSKYGSINYMDFVNVRSDMSNTIYKLLNDKNLTIGFIGGSVTDGYGASREDNCWRKQTVQWFKEAFPNARIIEVKASIGGTGSGLAMYRLQNDLLQYNPDLIFIEFAVNDAYEQYTADQIKKHIETIYRKIYNYNPYADIVMVYVSDTGNSSAKTIPAQEAVAEWYRVNGIRVDSAISSVANMEGKSLKTYLPDGVHPNDSGYKIYADTVINFLQNSLKGTSSGLKSKEIPTQLTTTQMNATLYKAVQTTLIDKSGWTNDTARFSWLGPIYGGSITTNTDGSRFTIKFKGTDFGIFYENGPYIGQIQYSVDGGAQKTLNGYLSYSNPKEFMLARDLNNGEHTITITFKSSSTGRRFAIGAFLVNGSII